MECMIELLINKKQYIQIRFLWFPALFCAVQIPIQTDNTQH